jgi:hypothetical protein
MWELVGSELGVLADADIGTVTMVPITKEVESKLASAFLFNLFPPYILN